MNIVLPVLTAVVVVLAVFIGTNGTSAAEVPVPEWYYDSPCLMPEGETLEHWLPWALPIELYEKDVLDCSELSAYAEWLSENCGYDTTIVVYLPKAGQSGHAWVVVEGRVLDAQTGVWDAGPWLPPGEVVFQDVYEAGQWSPTEWDWWTAYPELRSR